MRKMKDSGVNWIGLIPVDWKIDNPKYHFTQRKDRAPQGMVQLTASQKYGVITQSEYVERTGANIVTVQKDFDILKLVCAGDFVIHMRSFQGGLEYSEKTGSISSAYVMLIPHKTIRVPRYYKWFFKSSNYVDALSSTSDAYQVLLVANKYQTGFDQPKLCAMYVLKKLRGVNAVQTLSRLNRICPPYDKKTFVLDFVNSYEDMKAAFAPYYTTTLLSNSVTPNAIYDLEAKIDAYALFDPADIDSANEILYAEKVTGKQKQRLTFFLQKSKKLLDHYEYEEQREAVAAMRSFVRYYEFLLQVSCFEDVELHKKYNFIAYLLAYINIKHPGAGFNLDGKIKASNFIQKKGEEHVSPNLVAKPVMKLPTAEHFGLTEDKEQRLSEIIDEINSRTGKSYDNDVVVKAMLQIRDILMKSERLKTSAKNNTQTDFEFSYFDDIDDALIEGLSQNQDFFSLLLSNEEMKRQVLGIFSEEIYKSLRDA